MKKYVGILIALFCYSTPAIVLADSSRGVVAMWYGSAKRNTPQTFGGTCPNTGCLGDLVACGPSEGFFVADVIYTSLEGVCDDAGATPCEGRATGVAEGCFDLRLPPAGNNIHVVGSMLSFTARGRGRYCFDATGLADCGGSPPIATVIGKSSTVYHFRQTPIGTGPNQVTAEHTLETRTPFTLDGKTVQLNIGALQVSQFTAQPNPGDNCGGAGCGFAGDTIEVK